MNLLLVDDHPVVRDGLPLLLMRINPAVAVDKAATLDEAIAACHAKTFEIVLLDLTLGSDCHGIETLQRFRAAVDGVQVVVLSGDEDPRLIRDAIAEGAAGYLPKSYSSDLMVAALRLVLDGGIFVPASALQRERVPFAAPQTAAAPATTAAAPPAAVPAALAQLSDRQREVAMRLLRALPNKLIARELDISEGTVKAHVSAILQIVGAHSRVEFVLMAARDGTRIR